MFELQEDGDQYGSHIDQIERYLLDFAKLAEDVKLRKQALDKVSETSANAQEEEVSFFEGRREDRMRINV